MVDLLGRRPRDTHLMEALRSLILHDLDWGTVGPGFAVVAALGAVMLAAERVADRALRLTGARPASVPREWRPPSSPGARAASVRPRRTRLAARGLRVAVHASADVARACAVAEALPGDGHAAVAGDLADPAAVQRFVDEAAAALGGLDVLVNNAGVWLGADTHGNLEAWREVWRATLAVNLVGAADASFCALRHFRAAGGGRSSTSRAAARSAVSPSRCPTGRARRD
jgi:hypothetical protein